ncbi:MAG: hypothetical protein A2Z72_00355 [Omnitrophica bacterium RBG_13_46_9]|nr:MAG: hypothetical protein A2Z72_00355 [Omnitrophica bacterium RBG_13_46_9]
MKKILIIEDDRYIVQIVRDALEEEGYVVVVARDGQSGLELALNEAMDLVILDIMLPDADGFEICGKIKKKKIILPVIILSAKKKEADKLTGLELGADDYMTKPFSVKELAARIKTCLKRVEAHRHAKTERTQVFSFGSIKIDFPKMEVLKKNKKIPLTKKEVEILRYFINRKGEVVSRNDLLDVIWGYESSPLTRTVDTFMVRIRRKIEDNPSRPRYLKSVRAAGYKLEI